MHVGVRHGRSSNKRRLLLLVAIAVGVGINLFSTLWSNNASAREGALDRIVFDSDGKIFVADADGANRTELFAQNSANDATWSKTGRIAFTASYHPEDTHIVVMDEDGTNVVHLQTSNTDRAPAFSPDGTQIAFTSERFIPNDDNPFGGSPHRIYLMNTDGTNQRKLFSVLSGVFREYVPSFSPDGQKIAFIGQKTSASGTTAYDLYVADANGLTPAVRLTTYDNLQIDNRSAPAWSPDGTKIAFAHNRDIKIINADGTGAVVNLTNSSSTGTALEPAWSPDGQRITYSLNLSGTSVGDGLYSIRTDGSDRIYLNTTGARPAYRPRDVEPEPTPEPSPEPEPEPTPQADLSVLLTASSNSPAVGQNLTYTLRVTNHGPSTAVNTTATFSRPAGLDLISVSPARGACTASPVSANTTVCSLGDMANGEQVSVNIVTKPTAAGQITATASANSAVDDPEQNNGVQQLTLTVKASCVEEVTGLVAQSITRNGNQSRKQLTHTIRVRNNAGRPLHGLIHFVFDGLHESIEGDKGLTFFRTRCAQPLGRKYTSVGIGADDFIWLPGQTVTIEVPFSNLDRVEVNYNLRIYTGPGFP